MNENIVKIGTVPQVIDSAAAAIYQVYVDHRGRRLRVNYPTDLTSIIGKIALTSNSLQGESVIDAVGVLP
jgi:hypothetical protein